ncbi:beta-glucan synthesis-associated protein [Marasmius fiardii PR-910]|nr:beta-glucan synthesis-associated protein [Marasmius fiardii PR-910]
MSVRRSEPHRSRWSVDSDSPYPRVVGPKGRRPGTTTLGSMTEKYSLAPDPQSWGLNILTEVPEPDDYLHKPDSHDSNMFLRALVSPGRALSNLGCLCVMFLFCVALFIIYPAFSYSISPSMNTRGDFNSKGLNASGQVPEMPGNWGLIDHDTPREVYIKPSWRDSSTRMQLVFSDEFNEDGRTFYPGDDPYWEAVDLHYWGTNNLEWYDPEAITTKDGSLYITLSRKDNHDLQYQGGESFFRNKFCFTGGLIETAVILPGAHNVFGLWPAIWTLGNLGRAGYGASLEGTWPYTYDTCDVGTLANQTLNGLPKTATVDGDQGVGGALSFLPGQRLSRCTCPGESHPGPVHRDGTYVGRSAPEIDVFEAQVNEQTRIGGVSQSSQWAPFNRAYNWQNTSDNFILNDPTISELNSFKGNALQQATSVVTNTNPQCYELSPNPCFSVYGFEYKPGFDGGYITWITDNRIAWTIKAAGVGPDDTVQISTRPVPQEPMYLIMNLGMSRNFGPVDFDHLMFPTSMIVDYVRVYQEEGSINIGCDPPEFPTRAYIEAYREAYQNPNLTTWRDPPFSQPFPKNRLLEQC